MDPEKFLVLKNPDLKNLNSVVPVKGAGELNRIDVFKKAGLRRRWGRTKEEMGQDKDGDGAGLRRRWGRTKEEMGPD